MVTEGNSQKFKNASVQLKGLPLLYFKFVKHFVCENGVYHLPKYRLKTFHKESKVSQHSKIANRLHMLIKCRNIYFDQKFKGFGLEAN